MLPDVSTLALGHCAPSCWCVHIRQITPAHATCNVGTHGLPDMFILSQPLAPGVHIK